jgi:hypothetical protein
MAWRQGWCWFFIGLLMLPTGCTPTKKKRSSAAVKEEVAESFEKLKEGIADLREGHTDKFWDVLCEAGQEEASKRAKAFRADFAKREKTERDEIAAELGVRADDLREKLNGFGYVRLTSKALYKEYWLLAGAAVDHVTIQAEDEATLFYKLDDATHEIKSLRFYQEDGQWKAELRIP